MKRLRLGGQAGRANPSAVNPEVWLNGFDAQRGMFVICTDPVGKDVCVGVGKVFTLEKMCVGVGVVVCVYVCVCVCVCVLSLIHISEPTRPP